MGAAWVACRRFSSKGVPSCAGLVVGRLVGWHVPWLIGIARQIFGIHGESLAHSLSMSEVIHKSERGANRRGELAASFQS